MYDSLKELVLKTRSFRRFDESTSISMEKLKQLIDIARLSPSAANLQPLKYILSSSPGINEKIFPHLRWAAYLDDWQGPKKGERPTAYIIILGDKKISKNFEKWPSKVDCGIVGEILMLGVTSMDLGSCMFASVDRPSLSKELEIPDNLEILLVLAIGKPAEEIVLENAQQSIEYYRKGNVHHVPKRELEKVIFAKYQ